GPVSPSGIRRKRSPRPSAAVRNTSSALVSGTLPTRWTPRGAVRLGLELGAVPACVAMAFPSTRERSDRSGSPVEALAKRVDAVGLLPGEIEVVPPEVAVRGGRRIDGPPEAEVADDGAGAEVEDLVDRLQQVVV